MNSHRPIVGKLKTIWANAQRRLVELNDNPEYDITRILNEMLFELGLHVEYPSTLPSFLTQGSIPTKVLSRMLSRIRYFRRAYPMYGKSDTVYYLEDLIYAYQNKIPLELIKTEYVSLSGAFSVYKFYVEYLITHKEQRKLARARLQGMNMMLDYANRTEIHVPVTPRGMSGKILVIDTDDISIADFPLRFMPYKDLAMASVVVVKSKTHFRCIKNRYDINHPDKEIPIQCLTDFLKKYRYKLTLNEVKAPSVVF